MCLDYNASEGGMTNTPIVLDITSLGRFEIRRQQEPLSGGNWNRRKVCDLFKLLVTAEQHRLHREQVQEILWPAVSAEQASNSLGKTLYLLRRALEPELATAKRSSSSTYVTLDHDALVLVPEYVTIDADLFEQSVKQLQMQLRSQGAQEKEDISRLLDECDRLLTLYGGDYLPDDLYEDWAQRRRDRLSRSYSWLLEHAASLALAGSMGLRACEYLQALLERNSADEQTHRQLMLVYARLGRRRDALNQFQLLQEALREELSTQPLPETTALYRSIQAGRVRPDLAVPQPKSGSVSHTSGKTTTSSARRVVSPEQRDEEKPVSSPPKPEEEGPSPATEIPLQLDPARILNAELVGREEELVHLQRAYAQSLRSQQHIFVLSGESGIGKTRLAREFTRWTSEQGEPTTVLWGSCYELSASLPYQPIIEVIEEHIRSCSADELRHLLGKSASDLAKIVPEIRSKLPDLPQPEPLGPEGERRNLYNAVARYFHTLAAQTRLTIILDDLQWADSSTIQLLSYITSQSGNPLQKSTTSPFYILLYRADEVHESHPLRGLLASLSRLGLMEEARLKRLHEEAVQQLLVNIAGHAVRPGFTNEIYKRLS